MMIGLKNWKVERKTLAKEKGEKGEKKEKEEKEAENEGRNWKKEWI